jgi:ATP-dependent exoDNAse (exonuclease V) alpha subunit
MNSYPNQVNLTWQQSQALDAMLAGKNVFLTGDAGTGKSFIINEFRKRTNRNTVILAPTGAAALLVGGSTVHQFFQLPIGVLTPENLPELHPFQAEIIRATETIIIDEVSMLRADQLAAIDAILRNLAPASQRHLSMGGKQIIAVGDFLQLPAFAKEPEVREYLYHQYGGLHAFNASAWREACFTCFYLNMVLRQNDQKDLDILNAVRSGDTHYLKEVGIYGRFHNDDIICSFEHSHLDTLNAICCRRNQDIDYDAVCLCSMNYEADIINSNALASLPTQSKTFQGKIYGYFPGDALPVDFNLNLKIGARVMLRTNKFNKAMGCFDYVNGDIGTVVGMPDTGTPRVEVKLLNGRTVTVVQGVWNNYEYRLDSAPNGKRIIVQDEVGRYYQLPLAPAWAISIHKAQGLTLPQAHLVLGDRGCFSPGQLYVALSRVPSLSCLTIDRPVSEDDVIVDHEAMDFCEKLRHNSAAPRQSYPEEYYL